MGNNFQPFDDAWLSDHGIYVTFLHNIFFCVLHGCDSAQKYTYLYDNSFPCIKTTLTVASYIIDTLIFHWKLHRICYNFIIAINSTCHKWIKILEMKNLPFET
mmetsp:Transcript_1505/g.2158  ORF Transcript_1505/g.2158 Transcript_1505/m.2158 type:complete len:103 (+) Transcript_1505:5891-6199(+)